LRHRLAREAKVTAPFRGFGSPALEEMLPLVYDDVHPRIHPVAARSLTAHLEKSSPRARCAPPAGVFALREAH